MQAAERITVRGTPADSRPCATDAVATSSASTDVPFATGDAPGTDATTTASSLCQPVQQVLWQPINKQQGKFNVSSSPSLLLSSSL